MSLVRAGTLLVGTAYLLLAVFMLVDPHDFFVELGPFGARNDHYMLDNASFGAAFGVGLLYSCRAPAWRVPLLTVAALQYTLHALNHLHDIDAARPHGVGVADFVELAVAAAAIAWLAMRAHRDAGV